MIFPPAKILINKSNIEGLGIFAAEDIKMHDVIEIAPILKIPEEQIDDLAKTNLLNYFFGSGNCFESSAIILGYGSLYNHSYKPNARYVKKIGEKFLTFVAIQDIKKGEEILINYNGDPKDKTKLWFMED